MKIDEFLSEVYKHDLKHIGSPESIEDVQVEFDIAQRLNKESSHSAVII